jgi:uncharacterized protein (TIGR03083 family)
MDSPLPALRTSVGHLHELCRGLDEVQLELQSYCSEWSIAGVLSHLGSSAVILRRRLEDALAGRTVPDDFAPSVWDGWNAKSPMAQAEETLVEDEGLLEAFEALPGVERVRLGLPMGPLTLDFDQVVALRLNEHALHTWDIEVVFDDGAHLPADAAGVAVDNLELIARFTARPATEERIVRVGTTDPVRRFTLRLAPNKVEFTAVAEGGSEPHDLVLPAEAFCRLVYGRLDPDHTPPVGGDAALLDVLRQVFPGP